MHKRYCDGLDNSPKSIYRDGFDGKLVARVVVREGLTDNDIKKAIEQAEEKAKLIRENKEERRKRREAISAYYKRYGSWGQHRKFWSKSDWFHI